jgi:hypothetical protein
MTRKHVEEYCKKNKIQLLVIEGHDNAILKIDKRSNPPVLVYSRSKIIENLKNDMDHDDAVEFFEFNISGSYMGDLTPKFL